MHTTSNNNNYKEAQLLCERALAFMDNHMLTPHPINYAVIYHYVSNDNTKLKSAIEKNFQPKVRSTMFS
ncbi:hypothetical protein [Thalassotalea profundi]|uniref:Tetratricopeptide repeat protein n=1 Tax=Thalassotalea profundi TaxID=2036687 RepID=A0ABQ3IG98_9GAMM|nr:hypothetical protein [Thalassotalea profundi]GHE79091.1 hypothetical protein GCM10011501_03780 [Thalassotalea profundi]